MSEPAQLATSLSSEERRLFEETIARFEQAWHQNGSCQLDDFLPADGPLRAALLEELVAIDIEFRQRQGESIDKEEYERRFPELKGKVPTRTDQSTVSLALRTVIQKSVDNVKVEPTDLPATFGRYRIVKALGQGTMGAVYLAHDQQLDRQVALKIPKFVEAESQELLARFYREARLAAALRHPNICPVFDVGEIDGRHYITMAFIEGRSLSEFVASKRMQPQRQVALVIRKLAVALEEAHARGVIHRDLKPANVMIDAKGEPIVMDFGLARRASNEEAQVTHSGAILGTPAYMSPEQAEGDQTQIGPAADVYSLGVILYELLTGQRPFQGSVMSVLRQIGIGNPQPPTQLRTAIDPVLEGICLKMMSRHQADRYPSMAAVAQTLTDYLKAKPSRFSQTRSVSTSVLEPAEKMPDEDANAATFLFSNASDAVSVLPATKVLERSQRAATVATKPDRRRPFRAWTIAGLGLAGIVLLFGATFFLRVGNVDVKVVIDDPSLTVKFDKETVTFEGSGSPIRLKPGEHKFIVERDGLEVETDHFVVKKDGKHVLEVTVVDGKVVVRKDDQKPIASGLASKSDSSSPPKSAWPADAPSPAIAPFDAEQAKKHQEAWAKYLGVPVEYTNTLGMKFRLVPPGEFTMGSTPEEIEQSLKDVGEDKHWHERIKSEAPQHKVNLTHPIYLGVHEVKQAEYERVMGTNPSYFASTGPDQKLVERVAGMNTASHPVERVSWNDAAEFCAKLSQQEKHKPFYSRTGETVTPLNGTGYRLPSEAEWEYACRAGTTTKYWIGDQDEELKRTGWFRTTSSYRTHPVGESLGNPFGLYDVHGNVWEWVQDGWEPTYYRQFQEMAAFNPAAPFSASFQRVRRGGDWGRSASYCRASFRYADIPTWRGNDIGFRVSLSVDAVKAAMAERHDKPASAAKLWQAWPADTPAPAIAPFDAEQAKQHQDAWAKHLGVPVEYTNSIGMKFRLIPPGEFEMGSTPEEIEAALKYVDQSDPTGKKLVEDLIKSEGPQHKVILSQPYYFGVHEVRQQDYETVTGVNPSIFSRNGPQPAYRPNFDTSQMPVENVSWIDAVGFCSKLSLKENLKPRYDQTGTNVVPLEGNGYRLPSEAEWEHACRAGTTTRAFFAKDEDAPQFAWLANPAGGRPYPVGQLKPNPFGLFDIYGNNMEWVQDGWNPTAYEQAAGQPAVDPATSFVEASRRIVRGPVWPFSAVGCRSSFRHAEPAASRRHYTGVRVALSVEAVKFTLANPVQAESPVKNSVKEPLALKGHTGPVQCVAFSPDGKWLASASHDKTVIVWDAASGQKTLTLNGHGGFVTSVAFSSDGKRLASASIDKSVKVWDSLSGQVTHTLEGHTSGVSTVAFSPDGEWLASASHDKTVIVWDAASGQKTLRLKGHIGSVTSVAFSPDGKRLASVSYDRALKVWDTTSGQEVPDLKDRMDGSYSVVFSSDGKRLVSANAEQTVKVWDASSGHNTLTLTGHTGNVMSVAFSPDGKWLASASMDLTVKVWNTASGRETLTLKGHTSNVAGVAFSPDGKRLGSASHDQSVKVWEITPRQADD